MQIVVDTTTNQATVITINNGIPVFPTKSLDLAGNTLTPAETAKVQEVLTLIETKAS